MSNPTWDLLPFNQLCRTLARKTGQNADTYSGWTREQLRQALDRYDEDGETILVKHEASLSEDQLSKLKAELLQEIEAKASEEYYNVNHSFSTLRSELLAAIKATRRTTTEVVVVTKDDDAQERNVGRQHTDFATLLSLTATKQNVFLVGPAGSGKTSAVQAIAQALGLPFFFNGAIDNEYKLLGFTDAQGRVVHRPFRQAYTQGGVYLFDEVDASLPSAVLAFNAALANDLCDFPDICAPRHPHFYCLAAGNTFYGADHHYVGRMKQDAAFLDRFLVLDWHYDLDLERDLGLDLWPDNAPRALSWNKMVVRTREQAALKGLQVVISPRATFGGIKLLRSGVPWDTAVRVTLRKTMKASDWDKIMEFTDEAGTASKPVAPPPEETKPAYDWAYKPEQPLPRVDPKPEPTPWKGAQKTYFKVNSHGKTHRKFYNDLL